MFGCFFLRLFIEYYLLYHLFLHLALYFIFIKYNLFFEIIFYCFHFCFYFVFFVFSIVKLFFSSIDGLYTHLPLNFLSNLLSVNFLLQLFLSLQPYLFNICKFFISVLFKHFLFHIISHAFLDLNPSFDSLPLQLLLLFLNSILH